jgi:hypothetical protein
MTPETLRVLHAKRFAAAAAGAVLLALAAATVASAAASAEDSEAAVLQACAADVRTLCPGLEPGGGRLKQCLREHAEKVSPECRTALREARAARAGGQGKPATD